jgi:uncharacterized protein (DUF488 family)
VSANPTIFTIGHSTHPIEAFIHTLQAHGVKHLVDIRTIPRSRHNPQFNQEALPSSLASAGIAYTHLKGLGGLRRSRRDSPNTQWRNASFRGYADYMQTTEFDAALHQLIELARDQPVAIMCAEAVPWRCHRSMVADALVARHFPVEHIMAANRSHTHKPRPNDDSGAKSSTSSLFPQ